MTKNQTSPSSSDRCQWQRIFKTLIDMLQSQQSQIETLADERKFLEKYIHMQHGHWSSKSHFLESHIAQLKKEEVRNRKIGMSKLDLVVEMKERDALCYKKQFELAESDLDDFCACVEALSAEVLELKKKLKNRTSDLKPDENSKDTTVLEAELRKLKHSYKKLSSKKEAEISALLAEKDFVWNQFKNMESEYVANTKSKKIEVEHANEAIVKLQNSLQELQRLVSEKDEIIYDLKSRQDLDIKKHNRETEQANEKIEQLKLDNEELNLLVKEKDGLIIKLRDELAKIELDVHNYTNRKSRYSKKSSENGSMTISKSGSRKSCCRRISESAKQGLSQKHRASAPVHGLVRCSGKRRNVSDSPIGRLALFHSNFKVPKLKDSPMQ